MEAESSWQSGASSSAPASPDGHFSRASAGPSPGPPEDAPEAAGSGVPDALAGPLQVTYSASPLPLPTESSLASACSAAAVTTSIEGAQAGAAVAAAHLDTVNDDGRESPDVAPLSAQSGGGEGTAEAAAATGAHSTGPVTGDSGPLAAAGAAAEGSAAEGAAGPSVGAPGGSDRAGSAPGAAAAPQIRAPGAHLTEPGAAAGGFGASAGGTGGGSSYAGGSRGGSTHGSRSPDGGPSRPRSRELPAAAPPIPVASPRHHSGSARASLTTPPGTSRPPPEPFVATVVGHSPAPPRTPRDALDVLGALGHGSGGPGPQLPAPTPAPAAAPAPVPASAAPVPLPHEQRAGGTESGTAAANLSAAPPAHAGPLVRPFVERNSHSGGSTRGGTQQQGQPVGKRPGSHGSLRHGSAHKSPLPGSPPAGGNGLGSPRVTTGASSGQASGQTPPTGARTATADGAANGGSGAGSTPLQHRSSSREARTGHAAGGGAAAVKAAAAAAAAATGGRASVAAGDLAHDQQLQHQLMLGEAIKITAVTRSGISRNTLMMPGGGLVGVPGRRGRRTHVRSAAAAASAAATTAYFAELEAEIASGAAANKMLLPSGLARRLKAARMMATGPPPFQRRREPPPPPSPSGVKLDGFMLLEAADEELPEAVQAAFLESHSISSVESADLAYFVALRDLDVSDNRLPDLACLAPLQALVRLRAASCRLATLGHWQNGAAAPGGAPAGDDTVNGGSPVPADGGGVQIPAAVAAGKAGGSFRAVVTGTAAPAEGAAAGTGTGTETDSGPAGGADPAAAPAPAAAGPSDPAASAEPSESLLPLPLVVNPFQRLELLDLSFNTLAAHMVLLPGCPLALLPRLAELDLSNNRLRHLPSPAEIRAAAAAAAAAAAGTASVSEPAAGDQAVRSSADTTAGEEQQLSGVAFPALRRLRLASNSLKGSALASLAALSPPKLLHLDLSHNAISESPQLLELAAEGASRPPAGQQRSSQQRHQQDGPPASPAQPPGGSAPAGVLARLEVLDLTFNKVAAEGAVAPLTQLPALKRLLLAGNPLVSTIHRPHSGPASLSPKLDLALEAPPPRPCVANSLTARFARIAEAPPKQQATTLAAAAAAAITAAAAPERVTEAFDRMDAAIEQWRLNTVMEEDEEEEDDDEGDEAPEDRTFITGVGIQERRRRAGRPGSAAEGSEETADSVPEPAREATPEPAPSEGQGSVLTGDEPAERPLWESITDPTERLAVALGLDPLSLPMHTAVLTTDSAGAIAALRFALAHPLVEADDGLAPHPHYAVATTATQLKRKPRRAAAPQRLAPMETAAAAAAAAGGAGGGGRGASPRAAKIQTVEAMLDGMKGKLAALEASLAAQLAAVPAAPPPEAVRNAVRASKGRYGVQRGGGGRGATGSDTDSETVDDGASTGSGLPDDVIDQIERESSSDAESSEDEDAPMDPMQGIVLLADQVVAEEGTNNSGSPTSTGMAAKADRSRSVSPSPTRGHGTPLSSKPSVVMSSSPPQQIQSPPSRPSGSPPRSRKSLGTAGSMGPVALPGSAASALGYAS